jgi:hypothetical protein
MFGPCARRRRGETFRFYKGQRHYSGSFWSATESGLVLYESRLELARLLFADFDRSVHGIVAQPFLLEAEIDSRRRRHVPDYLLLTDSIPIVVDVKPKSRISNPDVASVMTWTRRAVEARGWLYEVWSGTPTGRVCQRSAARGLSPRLAVRLGRPAGTARRRCGRHAPGRRGPGTTSPTAGDRACCSATSVVAAAFPC